MKLFSPLTLGDLKLDNRLVMAPLTRVRSGRDGVPGPLVVEHYKQRASLGLIVSEGTYPSHAGQGFPGQAPGGVRDAGILAFGQDDVARVGAGGGQDAFQRFHGRLPFS